jgi:hypothetical protein
MSRRRMLVTGAHSAAPHLILGHGGGDGSQIPDHR